MKGKVKFYDGNKGFGFVIPDDGPEDLYFHARNCTQEFLDMEDKKNLTVEYEAKDGPNGIEADRIVPIIVFYEGKVKFFDRQKRYGKIDTSDGSVIHFKSNSCELIMPLEPQPGLPVRFQIKESAKGLLAVHVEPQDRIAYEFDGKVRENFQRYTHRHTRSLETWAAISLNPNGEPVFLKELAELALKEPWNFKLGSEADGAGYGILWNFIGNTFLRLLRQDKIFVVTKEKESYALFNSGLVNEMYDPIYLMFKGTGRTMDRPWEFMHMAIAGVGGTGRQMTGLFNPLPESATYFERTEDMLLDPKQEIHLSDEHAILDAVRDDRYPYQWLEKNKPSGFVWQDYRSMKYGERRGFLGQLTDAIKDDPNTRYDMFERLRSAKELARKRVSWNYKTAIPQYYPLLDGLSFLIPLALVNRKVVDIALVVTKNKDSGSYEGRTVFPLDWAYMSARLVCRPDSDWLTTKVSESNNSMEFD